MTTFEPEKVEKFSRTFFLAWNTKWRGVVCIDSTWLLLLPQLTLLCSASCALISSNEIISLSIDGSVIRSKNSFAYSFCWTMKISRDLMSETHHVVFKSILAMYLQLMFDLHLNLFCKSLQEIKLIKELTGSQMGTKIFILLDFISSKKIF